MASLLYRKCLHFDFMVHNLKHHQTGDKILKPERLMVKNSNKLDHRALGGQIWQQT